MDAHRKTVERCFAKAGLDAPDWEDGLPKYWGEFLMRRSPAALASSYAQLLLKSDLEVQATALLAWSTQMRMAMSRTGRHVLRNGYLQVGNAPNGDPVVLRCADAALGYLPHGEVHEALDAEGVAAVDWEGAFQPAGMEMHEYLCLLATDPDFPCDHMMAALNERDWRAVYRKKFG